MSDIAQSRDAMFVDIENMEWNDAILKRDVDSAASFQSSEFRLVIGVEGHRPAGINPKKRGMSGLERRTNSLWASRHDR